MWRSALCVVVAGCSFAARTAPQGGGDDAPSADGSGDAPGSDGSAGTPKRRVTLTFTNPHAEAMTSFAVMVKLDASRIDYAASPAGANLRFTDPDGTPLPYEIESWDPAGASIVWVRVPQIDAQTTTDFITMHYGDPALTAAQMPTLVWDHAALVYHLAEDPTTGTRDSTGMHAGSASGAMVAGDVIDAKVGKGMRFDGTGGGIHTSSMALARYTWMMWLQASAAPTGGINHEPITDGDANFNFAWDHTTPAYVGALAMHDIANNWHSAQGNSFAGSTWYLLAGTYDGTVMCLHVGASSKNCVGSQSPSAPGSTFALGDATSGATTFQGILDEVRVYDLARSDNWLAVEYASQTDTLITYGAAVPDP